MTRKTRPYREALLEALADPVEAANYLNAAKADSPEMFRKACLNVIQARQVTRIAREAGVTRESLYRSFSASGNPGMETVDSVLEALDIEYKFVPKTPPSPPAQSGPEVVDEEHTEGLTVRLTGISVGIVGIGAGGTIIHILATGAEGPSFTWGQCSGNTPHSSNAQELGPENLSFLEGFRSHASGSYRPIELRETA